MALGERDVKIDVTDKALTFNNSAGHSLLLYYPARHLNVGLSDTERQTPDGLQNGLWRHWRRSGPGEGRGG